MDQSQELFVRERARIIMVLSARPYAKKTWKKMENDEVGMNEGNEGYFYFTTKQKLNTHDASTRQAVQLSLENQNALKQALKQQSESLEALVAESGRRPSGAACAKRGSNGQRALKEGLLR